MTLRTLVLLLDTFEIKIYRVLSVFEELSVNDNLEIKKAPLSREDKAQVLNWYTSMARILLNQ